MEDEHISNDYKHTMRLGEELAHKLSPQDVIFLRGDLGSGKTTFSQGVAKGLGVLSRVISPTFIVVRSYKIDSSKYMNNKIKRMYHLDLYRLASENEVKLIDLDEYLKDSEAVVIIEWPDISQQIINKKVWRVDFETINETSRKIKISYE